MSTTPNSPIVCAKVIRVPVMMPWRASGRITRKKASKGRQPSVAATSIGLGPMASKAVTTGWIMKGSEYTTEPITRPVKVKLSVPSPRASVTCPIGPLGPRAMRM